MMTYAALYRLAGFAALSAGVLRIGAAFPLTQDSMAIEWLHTIIDVLLLMGLIGIYLARAERLGFLGLASFGVAVAALSFIGGPDSDPFGFSTYQEGATTLAIAMVGMSIAWVRAGERPIAPAACWFASVLSVGVLNFIPPLTAYGWQLGGILFGLGFLLAGLELVRPRA